MSNNKPQVRTGYVNIWNRDAPEWVNIDHIVSVVHRSDTSSEVRMSNGQTAFARFPVADLMDAIDMARAEVQYR